MLAKKDKMTSFQAVHSEEQIIEVVRLAREIWQEHYVPIIGQKQVESTRYLADEAERAL